MDKTLHTELQPAPSKTGILQAVKVISAGNASKAESGIGAEGSDASAWINLER